MYMEHKKKNVFIPIKDGTSPNICKISIIIRDKNASIFTKYNMHGDFFKKIGCWIIKIDPLFESQNKRNIDLRHFL